MVAAFFGCSCFPARFLPSDVLGVPQVGPTLPPSASPMLLAPFRSGPTHVV